MNTDDHQAAWLQRVEALIEALKGSSIGELELSEDESEIVIRREPGMVLVTAPTQQASAGQVGVPLAPGAPARAKEERGIAIAAPLTGVFYSAPSPTSPPFAVEGDVIQPGQVVALVEAMKVFNEIQAETSGRMLGFAAENGTVVQKGDRILRIEPI